MPVLGLAAPYIPRRASSLKGRKRLAPQPNRVCLKLLASRAVSASVSYAGLGPDSESRASAPILLLSVAARIPPFVAGKQPLSDMTDTVGDVF